LSLCAFTDQVKRERYLSKTNKKALEADAKLTKIWDKLESSKREMYKANIVVT
jgi:hypothetical protein